MGKKLPQRDSDLLVARAEKMYDEGKLRSAFRLYLAAAMGGDVGAQVNLGNFYDAGTGVTRNRALALYWYRRAWRRGEAAAASNIGVMYRDERSSSGHWAGSNARSKWGTLTRTSISQKYTCGEMTGQRQFAT